MGLAPQQIKIPGISGIIGIFSGKGGVGKTFVASNLALTLAKSGHKIGLLDADICCPNVFKVFGITSKHSMNSKNQVIPMEKHGVKIVSMAGLSNSDDEPIVWRGPIISKIAQQLLKESLWGDIDVLIVDFPTGTGDIPLTFMQNFVIDGVLLVVTPQKLATVDAKRAAAMTAMLGVPLAGVIENMRGDIFGEGGGSVLAQDLNVPLLASLPARKQIVTLMDQGVAPIAQMEEIKMIFTKIARTLAGEKIS